MSGTATLASTITIFGGVIISASTAYNFTVSGNNTVQVFNLNGAGVVPITLSGFTIANGSDANGGGINAGDEQLTLDHMTLTGNKSSGGGAIRVGASTATLTIRNSTISGNTATIGGGVYFFTDGGLLIETSMLSGNVATSLSVGRGGGGLYFYGAPSAAGFTVRISTFSGNSGGGVQINLLGGTALFQNSTLINNTAATSIKTGSGIGGGAERSCQCFAKRPGVDCADVFKRER